MSSQATKNRPFADDSSCEKSPLTDSNRRPPPYHGEFASGRRDLESTLYIADCLLIVGFEPTESMVVEAPRVDPVDPECVPKTGPHVLGRWSACVGETAFA